MSSNPVESIIGQKTREIWPTFDKMNWLLFYLILHLA